MGVVLDTSALVALERTGASLPDVLGHLAEEEVVVPAIVVAELLAAGWRGSQTVEVALVELGDRAVGPDESGPGGWAPGPPRAARATG